jgi:hypothetical protein
MKTYGEAEVELHFLLLHRIDGPYCHGKQQSVYRPARSVVTEPTELSRPLQGYPSRKQTLMFVLTGVTGFAGYWSGHERNKV